MLLPLLAVATGVLALFWGASWLLGRWDAPARRLRLSPLLWNMVRSALQTVVFLVGLLLAFDILGVSALVGAVLGTAGILGIALGFAFRDIVENYLAGALLSLRRPFRVRDLVRIGDHEGFVVRLTSRELVVLTMQGNHVQVPNATVFKSTVVNYTRNQRRLFEFELGIGNEEDPSRAMQVGVATLEAMRGVLDDPSPFARVQEVGDWSVVVRYHGWVDQEASDFLKVRSEAIRLVKAALAEAGIDMPEPIYRVQTRAQDEPHRPATEAGGPSIAAQAAAIDVAPDGKLEVQLDEDLARSDEPNLLER